MKIGVFDSGVGGKSVANAISQAMPGEEVVFRNDSSHVPYGLRDPEEILGFVVPIFTEMIEYGCGVIVVACNTVSTTLIHKLRANFDVPMVALEPMVKPASQLTKSGVIAVCATPTTLSSHRYQQLKQQYAANIMVIEPDCGDWAAMIEQDEVDAGKIAARINYVLDAGADVIVLACTHYHWIEEEIKALAKNRAEIMQPEEAIIRQLKRVTAQLG